MSEANTWDTNICCLCKLKHTSQGRQESSFHSTLESIHILLKKPEKTRRGRREQLITLLLRRKKISWVYKLVPLVKQVELKNISETAFAVPSSFFCNSSWTIFHFNVCYRKYKKHIIIMEPQVNKQFLFLLQLKRWIENNSQSCQEKEFHSYVLLFWYTVHCQSYIQIWSIAEINSMTSCKAKS